jgi:hypothetical protein
MARDLEKTKGAGCKVGKYVHGQEKVKTGFSHPIEENKTHDRKTRESTTARQF